MATIYNEEIMKKVLQLTRLQQLRESIPNQLAEKIIPTLNVNPDKLVKLAKNISNDTASVPLFTTSATKRTFLIGLNLSVTKDAIATSIGSKIEGAPLGSAITQLIEIRYEPLTAGSHMTSINFSEPFELEKGTAVSIDNTTAVGSIDVSASAYYYEVDPTD